MKVLHVAESSHGGCGTYLNIIVPEQIRIFGREYVRVLVPAQHADVLDCVPDGNIIRFDRPSRAKGLLQLARAFGAERKRFSPDVIHVHSTFAGAICRLQRLAIWTLPPIVYCPHGWVFDALPNPRARVVAEMIERALSPLSRSLVMISRHEYDEALRIGIPTEKLALIENGINPTPIEVAPSAWDDDRLKILFIGRFDRQKGVDIVLGAARTLVSAATFRLVGTAVKGDFDLPPTPPNVSILGWLSQREIAAQLLSADLVVVPSRWEGFGLVAVEAMRAAKPVVATTVGGLKDIVVSGVTGQLISKEDPAALASAIVSRSREEWTELGAKGRERFQERYSSDRMNREIINLYNDILRQRGVEAMTLAEPRASRRPASGPAEQND